MILSAIAICVMLAMLFRYLCDKAHEDNIDEEVEKHVQKIKQDLPPAYEDVVIFTVEKEKLQMDAESPPPTFDEAIRAIKFKYDLM